MSQLFCNNSDERVTKSSQCDTCKWRMNHFLYWFKLIYQKLDIIRKDCQYVLLILMAFFCWNYFIWCPSYYGKMTLELIIKSHGVSLRKTSTSNMSHWELKIVWAPFLDSLFQLSLDYNSWSYNYLLHLYSTLILILSYIIFTVKIESTKSLVKWVPGVHESQCRHQVETFSALLAICAGNSPVIGEFPAQMPVAWSFDVFFDLRLN